MKLFFTISFLVFMSSFSHAQTKKRIDSLAQILELSREQKETLIEINGYYLNDMDGIKDRADTGYNPPRHIQYQHVYTLIRRLKALEKLLTPEQYKKIREIDFDIYPFKEWLAAFYKRNKLPTIEAAVAKREMQLIP